jgi:hypothetical protein
MEDYDDWKSAHAGGWKQWNFKSDLRVSPQAEALTTEPERQSRGAGRLSAHQLETLFFVNLNELFGPYHLRAERTDRAVDMAEGLRAWDPSGACHIFKFQHGTRPDEFLDEAIPALIQELPNVIEWYDACDFRDLDAWLRNQAFWFDEKPRPELLDESKRHFAPRFRTRSYLKALPEEDRPTDPLSVGQFPRESAYEFPTTWRRNAANTDFKDGRKHLHLVLNQGDSLPDHAPRLVEAVEATGARVHIWNVATHVEREVSDRNACGEGTLWLKPKRAPGTRLGDLESNYSRSPWAVTAPEFLAQVSLQEVGNQVAGYSWDRNSAREVVTSLWDRTETRPHLQFGVRVESETLTASVSSPVRSWVWNHPEKSTLLRGMLHSRKDYLLRWLLASVEFENIGNLKGLKKEIDGVEEQDKTASRIWAASVQAAGNDVRVDLSFGETLQKVEIQADLDEWEFSHAAAECAQWFSAYDRIAELAAQDDSAFGDYPMPNSQVLENW